VEAGLDFADENLTFIAYEELARRIRAAQKSLEEIRQRLNDRGRSHAAFRVVLAGPPNAGKSSLFNALLGHGQALVSAVPGTTRDYLTGLLNLEGQEIELIDTAGREETPDDDITRDAQAARLAQLEKADLVLVCMSSSQQPSAPEVASSFTLHVQRTLFIGTKSDLVQVGPVPGYLQTSTITGEGLTALKAALAEHARSTLRAAAVAPSLTRCRGHLDRSVEALIHAANLTGDGRRMELVAAELRAALDELGAMVGAVYTEDLLDRVFSQFCIGK
jgi:tRNA modification GTPase